MKHIELTIVQTGVCDYSDYNFPLFPFHLEIWTDETKLVLTIDTVKMTS